MSDKPLNDEFEPSNDPHPWGEFLNARLKVIFWMDKDLLRSDKEIAEVLSMDAEQVYAIRTSPFNKGKE